MVGRPAQRRLVQWGRRGVAGGGSLPLTPLLLTQSSDNLQSSPAVGPEDAQASYEEKYT